MQVSTCNDIPALVALAEETACSVGEALLSAKGDWSAVDNKIGRDIKIQADREAEAIILDRLAAHSPFPVVSEETGHVGIVEEGRPYWVVDPLDGSFNYHHGIPLCCVSIALCRGNAPVFGCTFDFNRGECFVGGPGLGLRINGAAVTPAPASDILATGLPKKGDFSAERLARFGPQIAKWRQVRLIGSAALSLAWVAAGRFDAYAEAGILWWDVAAGVALVRAVGGTATVQGAVLEGTLTVEASRHRAERHGDVLNNPQGT